ncbi:histidine phosphatase family protein [Mycobacterium sp. 1274756.6]|uniref:histidine phosphatase family protein n=1 Tax=Mycobacterium sp. 1274756.6 TaxID=1834076 RepID=UPI0007FE2379|nr:histidine phosphatase family protein [Mycobacterium sp. 1274756.6]OBJ72374.1 phosphoglycerate mutase [Mycobacterium sp. 1274756.6]
MSGRLVLVRHGQSYGNIHRRLDTRPPGTALTPLGREQARAFAGAGSLRPGLLAHSVATRAVQTAEEIAGRIAVVPRPVEGIHEVQAGDLEDRSDRAALDEFHRIYQQWHRGDLDARVPGGESGSQVLDRYLPAVTELRLRYLDNHDWTADVIVVSHGAAIRLVAAVLAGVEAEFALDNHLSNAESVVLAPITDGRWSCVQWGERTPPFGPEPRPAPTADSLGADPMG